MRMLTALAAAAALSLAACAREADTRAGAEPDTSQEIAEAGEAVGEAAVQVGEAARVAITDAAQEMENAEQVDRNSAQPEPTSPN